MSTVSLYRFLEVPRGRLKLSVEILHCHEVNLVSSVHLLLNELNLILNYTVYRNILRTKNSQVLCSHVRFSFDRIWPPILVPPSHLTHATPMTGE